MRPHRMRLLSTGLLLAISAGCDDAALTPDASADMRAEDAAVTDGTLPDQGDAMPPPVDAGLPDAALDMLVDADPVDMTPPDLGPPVGEVVISRWQRDSKFRDDEIYAQAVFSPDLVAAGLQNPVGYLHALEYTEAGFATGAFVVPPIGETSSPRPDLGIRGLGDFIALDAGNALLIDETVVLNAHDETLEADGVNLYETLVDDGVTLNEEMGDGAVDLYIAGGADFAETTLPGAVRMPEPLIVLNYNRDELVPLRFGVPLRLEWRPSAADDDTILVIVESFIDEVVLHVDDADGAVDLTELLAENELPASAIETITLIRRRVQPVATRSGTVQISTHARQVLLPEPTGPTTVTPEVVDRDMRAQLKVAWWDGQYAEGARFDLGPGIAVLNQRIDRLRHVAILDLRIDANAPLGPRSIVISDGDAVQHTINGQLYVADELPMAGACLDAIEEDPITTGTWRGSLLGLEDSAYNIEPCLGDPLDGRDQAIPVRLRAGETLVARMIVEQSLYGIYLIRDCFDDAPVEWCYERSSSAESTEFVYTAFEDEDWLLVIDDARFDEASDVLDYVIDVQILPAVPLLVEPQAVGAGSVAEFEVIATQGEFDDATTVIFDGQNVDNVEFIDAQTVRFSARVPDDAFSRWIPIEAVLAGGEAVEVAQAAYIVPFRDPPTDCAGADDAPALRPGTYSSLTLLVDGSIDTPFQCLGGAEGPDAVYRIEVEGGETVRFWVHANDFDPVIYLLESCEPVAAIDCVDNTGFARTEYLEWTAGPGPATLYFVVDGFGEFDTGTYTIDMEVTE